MGSGTRRRASVVPIGRRSDPASAPNPGRSRYARRGFWPDRLPERHRGGMGIEGPSKTLLIPVFLAFAWLTAGEAMTGASRILIATIRRQSAEKAVQARSGEARIAGNETTAIPLRIGDLRQERLRRRAPNGRPIGRPISVDADRKPNRARRSERLRQNQFAQTDRRLDRRRCFHIRRGRDVPGSAAHHDHPLPA